MKRIPAFVFACVLLALCAGCGGAAQPEEETVSAALTKASDGYDVDLTRLSSTMVYSEVSNIMYNPDAYIGKTIRAKGTFKQNKGYYFVVINDATACCAQGLEFIWAGDHTFPDDYPAVDTEIIVSGTFDSYTEGDDVYYHIDNAALQTA